jgi:hypothetical protein
MLLRKKGFVRNPHNLPFALALALALAFVPAPAFAFAAAVADHFLSPAKGFLCNERTILELNSRTYLTRCLAASITPVFADA